MHVKIKKSLVGSAFIQSNILKKPKQMKKTKAKIHFGK